MTAGGLTGRGELMGQAKLTSALVDQAPTQHPAPDVAVDGKALAAAIVGAWTACRQAVQSGDKAVIRQLHVQAKQFDREVSYSDLRQIYLQQRSYFPQPARIDPCKIKPVLVHVGGHRSLEAKLFRVARGYWSMPHSKGYGRRLRFLVMDEHHEALIGILGLQSPSADLACRDRYLGVNKESKLQVVNNTLDAYTVGATPAYAPLLAGKLVAGFLCSPKIRQAYWRAYGAKLTTQLQMHIPQPLLAITTASAFGKSSIYNRLRFKDSLLAKPLGYTKGFGTVHLEHLYPTMAQWLRAAGKHVPAGFGHGPKVRWQNIMHTLGGLGISRSYLEHGIRREVFIFELVDNLIDVCQRNETPSPIAFDDDAWASYWMDRWCLPRASRDPDWDCFDANALFGQAFGTQSGAALILPESQR